MGGCSGLFDVGGGNVWAHTGGGVVVSEPPIACVSLGPNSSSVSSSESSLSVAPSTAPS